MDGLYMLEIFSVLLIITFYATSLIMLLKREAIQGRVIQYAYFHLYDQYKSKLKTVKDKVYSRGVQLYRYFIPDTYVMIEKPDINAIDVGNTYPEDAILVLEDSPAVPIVRKGNSFKISKTKKDPWVIINHSQSAPSRPSLMENYEQYKLLARDDNWHEMVKNNHIK